VQFELAKWSKYAKHAVLVLWFCPKDYYFFFVLQLSLVR